MSADLDPVLRSRLIEEVKAAHDAHQFGTTIGPRPENADEDDSWFLLTLDCCSCGWEDTERTTGHGAFEQHQAAAVVDALGIEEYGTTWDVTPDTPERAYPVYRIAAAEDSPA